MLTVSGLLQIRCTAVLKPFLLATVVQATIEQLATRIHELETENVTSRRRVRELELDLDRCRADVVRERTRVQSEIQKHIQAQSVSSITINRRDRDRKGKGRASEQSAEQPALSSSIPVNDPESLRIWEARYKEVVETKKGMQQSLSRHGIMCRYLMIIYPSP